ncbi:unique cartilage matrix-associated protein-like [Microcaecilia unicolor]|uniref:Unique cartilage matrix-associated protein n=1 Tax=Microcaecilia unicolor TaxID=1415580 RepID=A0A6P7Z827_9AMPH|nr:unique cartilage matrix-associated protein [Microcaecilia unicolor]XP_030072570.1 unique cartilage matrix-associated protein-like [Microcaecilia unicolor]
MNRKEILLLSGLATFVLLTILQEGEGAALGSPKTDAEKTKPNPKKNIFLQDSEASNFLKRRSKRSPRSRDEVNAENRQRQAADERRREYYEEQRNEYENYAEEQHDEHQERNREHTEQWRQWHYNNMYPSYLYHRYY